MAVTKWSWDASNGSATAAQVKTAYTALTNKGQTNAFSYTVWNDILDKIVASKADIGDTWSASILLLDDAKMASGDTMTALRFNCAVGNIPLTGYAWPWVDELGRKTIQKGDRCYGRYFIWLTDGVNHWIGLEKLILGIQDDFCFGGKVGTAQRSSYQLSLTEDAVNINLGDGMTLFDGVTRSLSFSGDALHVGHSFTLSIEDNTLAFYSTFNFFDYNTDKAETKIHGARRVVLTSPLVQNIEALVTQTRAEARYLAIVPEITLAETFKPDTGNVIYGAFAGAMASPAMTGSADKADITTLMHTGNLGTGYNFNFALDVNSGIGEFGEKVWLEETFSTLYAGSVVYKEYAGVAPEILSKSQLSNAASREAEDYSMGVDLVGNMDLLPAGTTNLLLSGSTEIAASCTMQAASAAYVSAEVEAQAATAVSMTARPGRRLTASAVTEVKTTAKFETQLVAYLSGQSHETVDANMQLGSDAYAPIAAEGTVDVSTDSDIQKNAAAYVDAELQSAVDADSLVEINPAANITADTGFVIASISGVSANAGVHFVADFVGAFKSSGDMAAKAEALLSAYIESLAAADGVVSTMHEHTIYAGVDIAVLYDGTVYVRKKAGIIARQESCAMITGAVSIDDEIEVIGRSTHSINTVTHLYLDDLVRLTAAIDNVLAVVPPDLRLTMQQLVSASIRALTVSATSSLTMRTQLGVTGMVAFNAPQTRAEVATRDQFVIPGGTVEVEGIDTQALVGMAPTMRIYGSASDRFAPAVTALLMRTKGVGTGAEITVYSNPLETSATLQTLGQLKHLDAQLKEPVDIQASAKVEATNGIINSAQIHVMSIRNSAPSTDLIEALHLSGCAVAFSGTVVSTEAILDFVEPMEPGSIVQSISLQHTFDATVHEMQLVPAADIEDERASDIGNKLVDNVERRVEID